MFIRKNASDEIAIQLEKNLIAQSEEQAFAKINKVAEAMEQLNSIAFMFDEVGLHKEAEAVTVILESVAAKGKKKKKRKNKSKSRSKSKSSMEGLTSQQMVDNLSEKGWVFNVDDECEECNDADDLWAQDDFLMARDDEHSDELERTIDLLRQEREERKEPLPKHRRSDWDWEDEDEGGWLEG